MPADWRMRKQNGDDTGDALDMCEIRINKDGTGYELVAVLATTSDEGNLPQTPFAFPAFAYMGLVWNIEVDTFHYRGLNEGFGNWKNNAHRPGPRAGEDGTWTAQAGQGADEGTEDAASASA